MWARISASLEIYSSRFDRSCAACKCADALSLLVRKKTLAEEIESLDVMSFKFSPDPLPRKPTNADIKKFQYQAFDILTMEKLFEREYAIKDVQRPDEIVSYYAKLIASNLKLPGQFSALAPKVWNFFQNRAFNVRMSLEHSVNSGHSYLLAEPCLGGNPILSIWQSDIILIAPDLRTYLLRGWGNIGTNVLRLTPPGM